MSTLVIQGATVGRAQSTEHAGLGAFFRNPQTSPAESFFSFSWCLALCITCCPEGASAFPAACECFRVSGLGLHSHLQSNEPGVPFTISPDYFFGIKYLLFGFSRNCSANYSHFSGCNYHVLVDNCISAPLCPRISWTKTGTQQQVLIYLSIN